MLTKTLTLEEVEAQFANWRSNKQGHSAIPIELWDQVKILLASYPHAPVLYRLGLTMQQAKNKGLFPEDKTIHLAATKDVKRNYALSSAPIVGGQPNQFLKVRNFKQAKNSVPEKSCLAVTQPNVITFTLQRGDTQLSLTTSKDEQVELIIKTFLQ
jgi:hypothetical protein